MDRLELARRLGAPIAVGEPPAGPGVVEELAARDFIARFSSAVAAGGDVFLADPAWRPAERATLASHLRHAASGTRDASAARGWLMIPSGGSTGGLKFARHDEETIAAAVRGFCTHFELERVNAIGVLPLHHVSGFMGWMRCALSGGQFLPWDWPRLEAGELPATGGGEWVISLVPTQLQRLLALPRALGWLRTLRTIFVGGGLAWPGLLESAARARLPVSLTYGMTETAAMVAALRPEEFLEGERNCGSALPHARVRVDADGVITVAGESLFRGYFPGWTEARELVTEDIGKLDTRGRLTVSGRRDAVIITGGKKVQPAEVEAVLRASGEFADVAVVGVPDSEWGEAVVACYPADARAPDMERIGRLVDQILPGFQRPKRFIAVGEWPRNAQGKINRAALAAAVAKS